MKLRRRALRAALVVSVLSSLAVPLAATTATAVAPAMAPEPLSPGAGETVGGHPTFSWTAVPGAVKYRVQVATTDQFTAPVYSQDTVNLHATPQKALPLGALYWRVAATDGTTSGIGPYATGTFTRSWADGPVLSTPPDGETLNYPDDPLLFTWEPQTGAQKYNVQIDDDVSFVGATTMTTNNPSFTLTNPQTSNQSYYWRVQGVTDNVLSPWSSVRTYFVTWDDRPRLISPAPGDVVTDVALEWTPVDGAATYHLQVSSNQDFSNNMAVDVITRSTRYSPNDSKFLGNGAYFWRVQALDANPTPNFGAWSSTISTPGGDVAASFSRAWNDTPTLLTPANGAPAVSTPTLSWSAVPHASHYEIELGTDATFSLGSYDTCVTNQTSFTPYSLQDQGSGYVNPGTCNILPSDPPVGDVMYWRVRARDVSGTKSIVGADSETFSFSFRPTSSPTPLAPALGATVAVPTLRWTPVSGISRYKLTIINDETNATLTPITTFGTSYTPDSLTAGKTYRWFVQTVDDLNRLGPQPLPVHYRTFTYVPATAVNTLVDLVAPGDGASSQIMPELRWEPVVGAASYDILYRQAGFDLWSPLGSTKATSFTSTGLPLNAGTYEWRVDAYKENGAAVGAPGDPVEISTFVLENISAATTVSPAKCVPNTPCVANAETPRLEWEPTPHTGGYLVHLYSDPGFSTKVRVYRTQYATLTPREALLDSAAGEAYYWFVQPCRTGTQRCALMQSPFAAAGAFRKSSVPVTLLAPADGATVSVNGAGDPEPITFTWEEYLKSTSAAGSNQGAKRYRVEVSAEQDMHPLLDEAFVDQTTYTPWEVTYPADGPLYWRVTAIDAANNLLTPSEVRLLTRITPPLATTYPADGDDVGGTPYFQWSAQPHVKHYELQVAPNADTEFSKAVSLGITTTTPPRMSAYAPTVSMAPGDYAWRVRPVDVGGRAGSWSLGGVFSVAPEVPALQSPAPGTVVTGNDLVLDWSPVTRAAKYLVESSASQGFGSLIEGSTPTTVMTEWAPVVKYPDGPVYWRVRALDAAGQTLSVSETWSIVKDGTAPTVKTKAPLTAAPVTGGAFTVGFSEPVKGVTTSTFTMKYAASGTPIQATVTPDPDVETTTATLKPVQPLVPGETYTLSLGAGIVDVNGNPLTPFSWTLRTALAVDSSSPVLKAYWDRDSSSLASGGAYLASAAPGTRLKYTFSGTSAAITGRRAPDGGYAEVWLDGVKQATATFYSSTVKWKQTIWSKTGLANGAHTVELRVLGTKPSAATGTWAYPDSFRYGSIVIEETSPLVVQSFRTVGLAGALGGSYTLATHTASGDTAAQPYYLMTFKGTGVSWKGIRGASGGIAAVYVDGALKAKVDTYGTTSTSGVSLWGISGLPSKVHTVKIVVTGTKRSTSKGYNVTVDSLNVV